MTIDYNVTGSERRQLADYIAGFLGSEKKYLGVPSCACQVGYIEVSKDGAITFDDRADSVEIETLLKEFEQEGFHAESATTKPQEAADAAPVKEEVANSEETACTASQGESAGLTVAVPLENVAVTNLTKLLDAKGSLIKRALGIDGLPIEVSEDAENPAEEPDGKLLFQERREEGGGLRCGFRIRKQLGRYGSSIPPGVEWSWYGWTTPKLRPSASGGR